MTDDSKNAAHDVGSETEQLIEQFIHHPALPHTRLSVIFDKIVKTCGELASWVWVVLIAVIVLNVTMRYVFGEGRIEFEELQWHLYSVGFLIGLSYCVYNDQHIRIDILHERFRPRMRAWVEFFGILILMIPYIAVILVYAPPFIEYSFATGEVSDSPGGLPYRWVIKSFMFIAYVLLLIAAVARLSRASSLLFGFPKAVDRPKG